MKQKTKIQKELDIVTNVHNGLLRPKDIVTFAADPQRALHKCFEWDDKKAGHAYRLWQARELIAVYVTVVNSKVDSVRAYVSLEMDRQKDGGGYRRIDVILQNKNLRQQLLNEALSELERFRSKYAQLKELTAIFTAIDKIKAKKRSVA